MPNFVTFTKIEFDDKFDYREDYLSVWNHWHYTKKCWGAAYSIWNLRYATYYKKYTHTKKEILDVLNNEFNYDYYFLTRELREEFVWKFRYLREKREKYIMLALPIKK